jgi:hypothetical protein
MDEAITVVDVLPESTCNPEKGSLLRFYSPIGFKMFRTE